MTPPADVGALRALLAAATPGPWASTWGEVLPPFDEETIIVSESAPEAIPVVGSVYYDGLHTACRKPDAALIAAAVNALPGLLDEVERLRAGRCRCDADEGGRIDPRECPEHKGEHEAREDAAALRSQLAVAEAALATVKADYLAADALRAKYGGELTAVEAERNALRVKVYRLEMVSAPLEMLQAAEAERDALRADYAAVAHAIGVEYVADHCPVVPGPVEAVVSAIRDAITSEGALLESIARVESKLTAATSRVAALRDELTRLRAEDRRLDDATCMKLAEATVANDLLRAQLAEVTAERDALRKSVEYMAERDGAPLSAIKSVSDKLVAAEARAVAAEAKLLATREVEMAEAIAAATSRAEAAEAQYSDLWVQAGHAITTVAAATAEAGRLRAALEWYADRETYCDGYTAENERCGCSVSVPITPLIFGDLGDRARTALASGPAAAIVAGHAVAWCDGCPTCDTANPYEPGRTKRCNDHRVVGDGFDACNRTAGHSGAHGRYSYSGIAVTTWDAPTKDGG